MAIRAYEFTLADLRLSHSGIPRRQDYLLGLGLLKSERFGWWFYENRFDVLERLLISTQATLQLTETFEFYEEQRLNAHRKSATPKSWATLFLNKERAFDIRATLTRLRLHPWIVAVSIFIAENAAHSARRGGGPSLRMHILQTTNFG